MQHALEGRSGDWPAELRGPRAKVEQAVDHAVTFHREHTAFMESEPYRAEAEWDAEDRCHVVRFRVSHTPPLRLSAILGDVVHNARSALDHIAWGLAVRHLGAAEAERRRTQISFPVTLKPRDFRTRTDGIFSAAAVSVLETMQPYVHTPADPAQDMFWVLTQLWNYDKHKSLHGSLSAIDITSVKFRPAMIHFEDIDTKIEWAALGHGDTFEDGTLIARVRFPSADPGTTKVEITSQPTVEVVFGEIGIGPNSVIALSGGVGDVFGSFAPLFPPR